MSPGKSLEGGGERIVPRQRAWHLVARTGDELPPTARLFLTHIADPHAARRGGRFQLVKPQLRAPLFRRTSPD